MIHCWGDFSFLSSYINSCLSLHIISIGFEKLHIWILIHHLLMIRMCKHFCFLYIVINLFLKLISSLSKLHLQSILNNLFWYSFHIVCKNLKFKRISILFCIWNSGNCFSVNLLHMSLHTLCGWKFPCAFRAIEMSKLLMLMEHNCINKLFITIETKRLQKLSI